LSDGDLDGLSIGTNPDVGMPAGAWSFIDSPETAPDQLSIVATETFSPGSTGNSLKMDIDDVNSIFLVNVFNEVIPEMPQRIVRARFDIFVPPGPRGGGSVYIGQGEGTGSLRGPQLSWFPDGSIQYWAPGAASFLAVPSYPRGIWQTVELDIDLVADTFDMSWGTIGTPLQQVQQGLPFRSGTLDSLDRFVFFRVGNPALSYLDNVDVSIVSSGDFDSDGDFDCDDIDALVVEIVAGTNQVTFDMTGDNLVDLADRTSGWLQRVDTTCQTGIRTYPVTPTSMGASTVRTLASGMPTSSPAWPPGAATTSPPMASSMAPTLGSGTPTSFSRPTAGAPCRSLALPHCWRSRWQRCPYAGRG
jgi:hypothetical protein